MHTTPTACSTTEHQSAPNQFLQKGQAQGLEDTQSSLAKALLWTMMGIGSLRFAPAYTIAQSRGNLSGLEAKGFMLFGRVEVEKKTHVLMGQLEGTEVWRSSLMGAETLPAVQLLARCWELSTVTVCLKYVYKECSLILHISYLFLSFLRQRCLSSH